MIVNHEDSIDNSNNLVEIIAENNGGSESSLARQIRNDRNTILPRGHTPFDEGFLDRSKQRRIDLNHIKFRNPNFISTFAISIRISVNDNNTTNRKSYETPYCQNKFMVNGLNTIGSLVMAIANYSSIVCYDRIIILATMDYLNDNGINAEYDEQQQRIIMPDIKL